MRKALPIIAGALLAGAVGLIKNVRRARKASSSPSKAKRAAAAAQQRGARLSGQGLKKSARGSSNSKTKKSA